LNASERAKTVLIVQDPFTSFYDASVVEDFVSLCMKLGYNPVLLPFKPNGKPEHVKGFLTRFAKTATDTAAFLNEVASLSIPMVGVDASLVLCYRDEYTKTLGSKRGEFFVNTVHEWLLGIPDDAWERTTTIPSTESLALLSHCSEKTALPASEKQWQTIFGKVGQPVDLVAVGCCGMAGTYGHEADQKDKSLAIYGLSWEAAVKAYPQNAIMATGYSCRSQVARIEKFKPRHPLQLLLAAMDNN